MIASLAVGAVYESVRGHAVFCLVLRSACRTRVKVLFAVGCDVAPFVSLALHAPSGFLDVLSGSDMSSFYDDAVS